ncbi:MAG: ATP-binding cassette domain-containing protein [Christensenellales bacterium]
MMHGIYANWDDAAFSPSLCARLDLPKGKKVKDFSRGTKMKLAIAVALSHKAKLLVLDEATGGLDPLCATKSSTCSTTSRGVKNTRFCSKFAYRDRSGKNLRLRGLSA